ncbi:MAG: hypothetical protein ACI9QQ_000160 [Myxococcota bacterium]|jgi:hypothetical protein
MNASVTNTIKFDSELLGSALDEATGGGPVVMRPLAGGRNSRVYRVEGLGGEAFVAKIYHQAESAGGGVARLHEDRKRDRRGCEFAALRFLFGNGMRSVPEPIATYPELGFSVMRLIEGQTPAADSITDRDIDALSYFLGQVDFLKLRPAARALPEASEAGFSLGAIAETIRNRTSRLAMVARGAQSDTELSLRAFMDASFRSTADRVLDQAQTRFAGQGLDVLAELAFEDRTLSPSDFGFHNALRRPDGSLAFLDFEHFGWDDPAKVVCDFLLHPAMTISHRRRRRFFARVLDSQRDAELLRWRVETLLPVFAIKWCTILLNEFTKESSERRTHASHNAFDLERVQYAQLAKAKVMLETATTAQETFPYAG